MTSSMSDIRVFAAFGLILMAFAIVAAALMGLAGTETTTVALRASVEVPGWIEGQNVGIREGLAISPHASKHVGETLDAWKIYALLLEGQCVASTVWCGPFNVERLHLCVSPSGLIGGIFIFDDEIIKGGFGARARYWESKLDSPEWGVCQ